MMWKQRGPKRGPDGLIFVMVGFSGALSALLVVSLGGDSTDLGPLLLTFSGIFVFGLT
jgi:hypothetical protein